MIKSIYGLLEQTYKQLIGIRKKISKKGKNVSLERKKIREIQQKEIHDKKNEMRETHQQLEILVKEMDPQKLADYIRNDLEWVPKNDLFFKDDKIKVDYCTQTYNVNNVQIEEDVEIEVAEGMELYDQLNQEKEQLDYHRNELEEMKKEESSCLKELQREQEKNELKLRDLEIKYKNYQRKFELKNEYEMNLKRLDEEIGMLKREINKEMQEEKRLSQENNKQMKILRELIAVEQFQRQLLSQ